MQAAKKDITRIRIEAIVNAANGRGPMGVGVAYAIASAAGPTVRTEVANLCKEAGGFKEGDCYVSGSGALRKFGVKAIYHAVTMEYPGGRTSLDTIGRAMRATLERAIADNIKSIAFPGLGTGVGALDLYATALTMVRVAKPYSDRIAITFVDINSDFIDYVQKAITGEK
jgi:O-acetyl-ADP-ribose deacetylase (regulator of RNase III)